MDVKSSFLHGFCLKKSIWNDLKVLWEILVLFINSISHCMIRNKNFMLVMRRFIVGFINIGFNHCEYDPNVYVLHVHGDTLIVASYVDDLHITQNNASLLLGLKNQLAYTFEMIDIGLVLVCFISFWTFKFCKWMMVSFFINQNILWLFGNNSRPWC